MPFGLSRLRKEDALSLLKRAHLLYLALILPRAQAHARVVFRELNADVRDELRQEMFGLLWQWTIRLLKRGKDPSKFSSVLVIYAARHVRAGR